jgi:hypothetical protein
MTSWETRYKPFYNITGNRMNLLCEIPHFDHNNVFFLDTKRNMVIEGKFTKLIYSDATVALNGIYLYCPIQGKFLDNTSHINRQQQHQQRYEDTDDMGRNKVCFQFSLLNTFNIHLMKELTRIEHEIIEHYKDIFQVQKSNMYTLRNQLKNGMIKIMCRSTKTELHHQIVIKISGVWETDYNVGITYKFLQEPMACDRPVHT